MIGDGLVTNFAKISLEETDFTRWLEKKPLRYAMFMQIVRRASKNKGHYFMMSKTEHKKFGLSVNQAGQIERFLEALIEFKCVQKTGSNQEPGTLKTGTQNHHTGATIYRLINNDFIDLSKIAKNEKQEPKKEKTGSNQEGSREESITSTSARAKGIDINTGPKSSSVEQNTFGVEKTRLLIEESKKEPPFPKVPAKGFSPVERSQALTALLVVAHEFGREIRWESFEEEIAEAVDLFGMDQLIESFRSYAELCRQKGWRVVQWDRFKANKLNNTPTKKAVESVKKMPEYLQDQSRKWDKRGAVSYTSVPNMQKLSQIYTGVQQEPMDEEKRAFVERSKVLHSKLQRPGLTVRFGMLYADKDLYENVSNAEIIELSNKVIDKKISEAKLNKITKNEIRVDRSDLKECLANINRLKSLENVHF